MKPTQPGSNPFPFQGLNLAEVRRSAARWGKNTTEKTVNAFWRRFRKSFLDPVFLILLLTVGLYIILGETTQAIYMGVAVLIIAAISFFQERRSDRALEALKKLTGRKCQVIRDNRVKLIDPEEIVVGDYVVVEEGSSLPADGRVLHAHDFAVNESLLTGEAAPVWKGTDQEQAQVYAGTLVTSGLAVFEVTVIGRATRMGRIAGALAGIRREKSPLEKQIDRFVTQMSVIGGLVFILIWGLHVLRSGQWIASFLQALTPAMSILPEEIPVAFSTFMALGAWRLMQRGIMAKDIKTVEALGVATVICLDKTGTITRNTMELQQIYLWGEGKLLSPDSWQLPEARQLLTWGMWASEPAPFDPMEKELHRIYGGLTGIDERKLYQMEHEYPLAGRPPMMTHVFCDKSGKRIIAAKGAPEKIASVCSLDPESLLRFREVINGMAARGYRVLAVAEGQYPKQKLPAGQEQIPFRLLGLLSFFDPPKKGLERIFGQLEEAGIEVKVITGDDAVTTKAIAGQAGLKTQGSITGEAIMRMNAEELEKCLHQTTLFTRMFPEAKLCVIQALKQQGHIVAMTGDGVNDAPALKAAHIGIAMGQRGAETAREAATLVLTDDRLARIKEAIEMGRQIHSNLKRAIRYIVAIHLPIILVVTLPLLLHWQYPDIFSPLHVVFLELVMGPTCSIVYENEPPEQHLMQRPPGKIGANLLTFHELGSSLLIGLVITLVALLVYQAGIRLHIGEKGIRAMVFSMLVCANVALTLIGRTPAGQQKTKKNPLIPLIIAITLTLLTLILFIPQARSLFGIVLPAWPLLGGAMIAGVLSVGWCLPLRKQLFNI